MTIFFQMVHLNYMNLRNLKNYNSHVIIFHTFVKILLLRPILASILALTYDYKHCYLDTEFHPNIPLEKL